MNRRHASIAVLALATLVPGSGAAQPSEDAVKAAFLPKFARYVAWPAPAQPGASAPMVLCIVGTDPFGHQLDVAAASETINGHGVTVRRTSVGESFSGCHLAFLGGGEKQAAQDIATLAQQPVLTVTDDRAGHAHGIIHFVVSGGRVRFFIDNAAAVARGLTIDSRLLALALSVRQVKP